MLKNKINISQDVSGVTVSSGKIYWISKRGFDVIVSFLMLPLILIVYINLLILNRYFNPGPIFFVQERMGKNCKSFRAIKFRSMLDVDSIVRGHNDPVEQSRITPLGSILRHLRIDEIPQIINVIKGDMSLIGPRPDYYEHAKIFLKEVKGYRARHTIRPGITGLSQIRLGYAVGLKATKSKAAVDHYYIKNAGFILDFKIFIGTIITVLRRSGQ
jgi:lipopolysaccharide/colanic/teichoic acid biosynthesis glycosyltransferase